MEQLKNKILDELGIEIRIVPRPDSTFSIWFHDVILVDYCNKVDFSKIKLGFDIYQRRSITSIQVGIKSVTIFMADGTSMSFGSMRKDGEYNVVYLKGLDDCYDEIKKMALELSPQTNKKNQTDSVDFQELHY